jgi:ferredoxin-thioredoxin reductase catalytic chain
MSRNKSKRPLKMNEIIPDAKEVETVYHRLFKEAEASGYHLNPDIEFTKSLIQGLLINEKRYGYWSCPCRLADCEKESDLDIICPCDYRDADLNDFGMCYCKLYVSRAVQEGKTQIHSIPERRPVDVTRKSENNTGSCAGLPVTIWRCRVCGYLCSRENPPEVCPICKARKERFERFSLSGSS